MTQGRITQKRVQSSASTLPEIGRVKIGAKATNAQGKEYPTSLDHFIATGKFTTEFQRVFGEKPTKLTVMFISDDLQEVCNERYECWDKGKLWGSGDGSKFRVYDPTAKAYVEDIDATDPRVTALKWDMMLTLRFVLPEMKGILGVWVFSTKAKMTTIPSVIKAFDFVRERANTIVGFPFSLIVEKKKGYSPGEARNYPVVSLIPNFSDETIDKVRDYIDAGGKIAEVKHVIEGRDVKQLGQGGGDD